MKINTLKNNFILDIKKAAASIAQRIYDEWDDSDVDTYANGGICHLIADNICIYLDSINIEATSVSAGHGDVHIYTLAKIENISNMEDGIYEINIPPYVYERGSGYHWTKIPNIKIDEEDVHIDLIDRNVANFEHIGD